MVGQRVRNYTITSESSSSSDGSVGGAASTVLVSGDAIGTKRIHLLPAPITVQQDTTIRLLVTHAVATPQIKSFVRPAPPQSLSLVDLWTGLRLVNADDAARRGHSSRARLAEAQDSAQGKVLHMPSTCALPADRLFGFRDREGSHPKEGLR